MGEFSMLKDTKTINRLNKKIAKCKKDINNKHNTNLRKEQLQHYTHKLHSIRHIRRKVVTWEKANHKWFNGNSNDVYTFKDLIDHCNELLYGEKPIDLITTGIYIPISGSAIAPYDLREYLYLPASLVEEDINIKNIKDSFKGYHITGD